MDENGPQFEDVSETFLGMTKVQVIGLVVAAAIFMSASFGAAGGLLWAKANDQIGKTKTATAYVCSTTTVLDQLVVAAANQIKQNFADGTYTKLERQGILTPANVQAARIALQSYQKADATLKANGACQGVGVSP